MVEVEETLIVSRNDHLMVRTGIMLCMDFDSINDGIREARRNWGVAGS